MFLYKGNICLNQCYSTSDISPKLHPRHEYMQLQSRTSNIKSYQQSMEIDEQTGKLVPKLMVKEGVQVDSHRLLTANSFIKSSGSGLNIILPYGERVMEKLIRLIDQVMQQPGPMDKCVNGIKLAMPCLSQKGIWEMTGRWEQFGSEMYRLMDRKGSHYCLAPTHEEVVTHMFDSSNFPARLYQIGRKFRDESWPKHGLLRAKEFIMKDMYSFDKDVESATISYNVLVQAYKTIFDKLGLNYLIVEGDTGQIGGNMSHEFHVISDIGEDHLLHCNCKADNIYAANIEMAKSIIDENHLHLLRNTVCKLVKNSETTAAIARIPRHILSELPDNVQLYKVVTDKPNSELNHWLTILPKNYQINEVKAKKLLNVSSITIHAMTKVEDISWFDCVLIDRSLISLCEKIEPLSGENNDLLLYVGDVRISKEGELCCNTKNPNCCNSRLSATRGIEVGHVFYLGTKYSSVFNIRCKDSNGVSKLAEMGCYGIGVSRVMQAVVENSHDHFGPIWPFAIAPYRAIIITLFPPQENKSREELQEIVQNIYDHSVDIYGKINNLSAFRGEVLYYDDMRARVSEKLRFAESIGIPYIVVLGKNFLNTGKYEIKNRNTGETHLLTSDEALEFFQKINHEYNQESYYGF